MSIAMADSPRRHRITVDEYHRMYEAGEIAPDARVELIDGEIIDMPPIGNPHAATTARLVRLLGLAAGDQAIVWCQAPVQLGDFSEPQPDLALLSPREDFYSTRRATPADMLLAIEVSDTTLKFDRGRKMSLYARHAVPELWVIDVNGARLHLYRHPSGDAYLETSSLDAPASMSIERLSGVSVDLSSIYIR